jgi:hypothetical protein
MYYVLWKAELQEIKEVDEISGPVKGGESTSLSLVFKNILILSYLR